MNNTKTPKLLDTIFSFIRKTSRESLNIENGDHNLDFNNSLGKGSVNGTSLKSGIELLQFEVNFKNDFSFELDFDTSDILTLAYCSSGGVIYNSENLANPITINNFQTAILSKAKNTKSSFTFQKEATTKMTLILIDKNAEFSEYHYDYKTQLFDAFKTKEENKDFFYVSSYNLKISEQIINLNALESDGIVKKIMTESIVYNILGLELKQHMADMINAEQNIEGLTKQDYKTIKDISNYLKNSPELPHCINTIISKYGISAAKLQIGFKFSHNATFIEHLKNLRLEKAEQLLRTTDMNISEAIYSVGFTSRSYFSKIFKERYNCSPSYFKKHLINDCKMTA